ncbi:MAG: ethanolamine ammonia-lyase subunit EutC [Actinomycetota bacterium]
MTTPSVPEDNGPPSTDGSPTGEAPADPWVGLRRFTAARIGQGRVGHSQTTAAQLQFQLDHARARDAVHAQLDRTRLDNALAPFGLPRLWLHSQASDRAHYLRRPDLGRRLDGASRSQLEDQRGPSDLALVIADGLSATAIDRHAPPFLAALLPLLAGESWRLAPLSIVEQGRVAVGDEVAATLGARMVLVLIGERPGLSAPDSLGLYLTWAPRSAQQGGRQDSERNCISNVRQGGMSYAEAAVKSHYLLREARRRQLTGVELKDDAPAGAIVAQAPVRDNTLGSAPEA